MGQPGLENAKQVPIGVHLDTSEREGSTTAPESPRYPVDADAFGPTFGPADPVEAALARALDAAAVAGRFDVVAHVRAPAG